jgi:hypothetical protein
MQLHRFWIEELGAGAAAGELAHAFCVNATSLRLKYSTRIIFRSFCPSLLI